jgi:histidinol-phosphate aminotransferase
MLRGATRDAKENGVTTLRAMDTIRPAIRTLTPYVPGKPIEELERELGISGVVKLASNENPLGPSPLAIAAINTAAHAVNRYPDGSSYYLREALGAHWEVPPEWIAVGSGSNDLIDVLCRIHLEPGSEAILSDPSFVMFAIAAKVAGGNLVRVPGRDLAHDPEAMLREVTDRTRLVYFANPDNPTGTIVRRRALEDYFRKVPDHVLTILDEAYFEYVTDPEYPNGLEFLRRGRRVAVLRTFSKVYALAGLRVGYGFFPEDVVSMVHRVRLPFNVTTVAQAAARASLTDGNQVLRAREANEAGLALFRRELPRFGIQLTPTWANFVLARFPGSAVEAARTLERQGVIIRPMTSFGLPAEYARISVGTRLENEGLVEALARLM